MTIRTIALLAAALVATTASVHAASFTGTFGLDNQTFSRTFTLDAPGTVTVRSLGYAGGVNAAGAIIARGGFDSFLSIYDPSGLNIALNDDGADSAIDPVTGNAYDAAWIATLDAGTYTVFLSQSNNGGPGQLGGAFGFDGQPHFRNGFVDFSGSQRDGHFALDILGASSVPEAGTTAVLLAGLGLLGFAARRRAA